MEKHIFALYKEKLSHLVEQTKENEVFSLKDAPLWNRLVKIVRIKEGEHFILFDQNVNIALVCASKTLTQKRTIVGTIIKKRANKKIEPSITLYLPILKKEAFEYVAYVAAQMGVNTIIPVITEKSEKKIATNSNRLKNIFIAACEQSKNFVPPKICSVISLEDMPANNLIFFTEHGAPLIECIKIITASKKAAHNIIVGPEGGFTQRETTFIREKSLVECALTPTILRSREAITLGIGIVRSVN
jgi:16S rRNA (uracil1498-N3)-methyltransferase